MALKNWNIESLTGYKPHTTFYLDFSMAEPFGISAIADTYNRAFNEWKSNIVYITEFVMVLNWKIWEHYETNPTLAKFYESLWEKADEWCISNLKGDDLRYFLNTTD
jgi:hypothetical protein